MIFQPSPERISLILSKYQGRKHTIADDDPEVGNPGRPKVSQAGIRVMQYLRQKGKPLSAATIAKALGLSKNGTRTVMQRLRKEGKVRRLPAERRCYLWEPVK